MATEEQVLERLATVDDPEINKPITELGMVEQVVIEGARVGVKIKLTVPGCPLKDTITREVTAAVMALDDVDDVQVAFGSIVHIKDQESGTSRKFQIVGSTEADLSGGKLSSESPIGSALIGGRVNQIVKIPSPRGPEKQFKITKIEAA